MDANHRRNFLFLSTGAAIGNFAAPGLTAAHHESTVGLDFSHSGLVTGEMKPLKHKEIPGFLSAEQIAPHHTAHYGGALRGYKAADEKIEASVQAGERLGAAEHGALKRSINSKGNSVVLHEMYFDGLAPKQPDPGKGVRQAIEKRFGSLEHWATDFVASAKGAAGWALLVKHPVNNKLYNVVSDEHAMGVVAMSIPLVVLDTYEHAFYIDYENRKAEYIETFLEYIDWNEVNARYQAHG